MLSAHFNRMDNYDVHCAANPVTRIISTVYGDKTVNLKEQLTWSSGSNFSLTGRAGYFFRETVRSVDQYDKSDYQRITRLDIRDYSNVQNFFRLLYNHTFYGGSLFQDDGRQAALPALF